jgi:hypothetical protein
MSDREFQCAKKRERGEKGEREGVLRKKETDGGRGEVGRGREGYVKLDR